MKMTNVSKAIANEIQSRISLYISHYVYFHNIHGLVLLIWTERHIPGTISSFRFETLLGEGWDFCTSMFEKSIYILFANNLVDVSVVSARLQHCHWLFNCKHQITQPKLHGNKKWDHPFIHRSITMTSFQNSRTKTGLGLQGIVSYVSGSSNEVAIF